MDKKFNNFIKGCVFISWVGILGIYLNLESYTQQKIQQRKANGELENDTQRLRKVNNLPEEYKEEFIEYQKRIFKQKINDKKQQQLQQQNDNINK